jgi:hypothetical protein
MLREEQWGLCPGDENDDVQPPIIQPDDKGK